MISDEDVMLLFEQADPARLPDRVDDRVDDAGEIPALRKRSIHVTLTESDQTEARPAKARPAEGRRWRWIGTAAASAIVAVGGLVLLTRDDTPSSITPSTDTSPSTDAAASAAETGVAQQFIAAFNEGDLAAMEQLSTDGLTFDDRSADELPSLWAWYEAFDWRWEDATCSISSLGTDVRCELFERNRLTDITNAQRPATVTFTMIDGQVEAVKIDADLSDYSPNAFSPFRNWVSANHPDDETRMWSGRANPVLTAESAALFDQYLGEFTDELRSAVDE